MSEIIEITKCYNPNQDISMCRECQRIGESKTNEYEAFNIQKSIILGYQCNGYVSKREVGNLFEKL